MARMASYASVTKVASRSWTASCRAATAPTSAAIETTSWSLTPAAVVAAAGAISVVVMPRLCCC